MLHIRTNLDRKPTKLYEHDCSIEKVVELDSTVFDAFLRTPLADREFIAENKDLMYQDSEGTYHCLLVLGVDRPDGVLIEAEGADYARYAAYVPQARSYIEHEAIKFADDCVYITPDNDGTISVYLEDIENFTGSFVKADNCLVQIFSEAMKNCHRIAKVEKLDAYSCINITPSPNMAMETRLCAAEQRANTLDEIIDAISNRIGSEMLYDILSQDCGFSNEQITEHGFDLEDYFQQGQPTPEQDISL